MLTISEKRAITVDDTLEPRSLIKGDCLSTDEKPVSGIANGSTLFEMDTATMYKFDQENDVWRAWS